MTNIELEYYSLAKEFFRKNTKIDWEQRRYEISKDVLCTFNLDPRIMSEEYLVNKAISIADTLIEKLKENEKQLLFLWVL